MVKRGVDLVFAAVLLLVTLPVLLLSALLIGITSPGPILFRQTRMGRDFRPFQILKFRTMAHAEGGLAYTLGPDPRITPIGKWLRRTKIDEMPQLWNVLRGEMSMVGPRPVLPELTVEFRSEYLSLLRWRPGLTDPASLKYSQEVMLLASAPDPMAFFKQVVTPDKLVISLAYAERATVWSDLGTILMTGAICFVPALSALYGAVPDPVRGKAMEIETKAVTVAARLPALTVTPSTFVSPYLRPSVGADDDCIFAHSLVEMEAAEEQLTKMSPWPWIPLPEIRSGQQSASRNSNRSASRL